MDDGLDQVLTLRFADEDIPEFARTGRIRTEIDRKGEDIRGVGPRTNGGVGPVEPINNKGLGRWLWNKPGRWLCSTEHQGCGLIPAQASGLGKPAKNTKALKGRPKPFTSNRMHLFENLPATQLDVPRRSGNSFPKSA